MNFPDRIELLVREQTGRDELGRPIYADVAHPAAARVELVSAREVADGALSITDLSVRVPSGYPALANAGRIKVTSGPFTGQTLETTQTRRARTHVRYVARVAA